jgi:aspartokinase/homoserine dehydrogenase 1
MPTTVVKFGGSVLGRKRDFERIVQVVKNYHQPIVIVVSAFNGVSEILAESPGKARDDDQVAQRVVDHLYQLKKRLIETIITDEILRNNVLEGIQAILSELHQYLWGISLAGDASPALEDHVLSFGEKLSALFLKSILMNEGIDSKVILPETMGLLTDGVYGNASVDFAKSSSAVKSALSEDMIYIVPGSYGISSQGKITMLGQSGSDYFAASLAKCTGARSVDIWKGVNGFLSADPDLVKNPVQIKMLTYDEAAELAYFGTKILHPRTVEPLINSHIPIRIFNLNESLDVEKPYSIVNSEKVVTSGIVKSVTYSDNFGILKLKGPGVGINPGILAKVTTALYGAGINIISVLTSQISINILLAKRDLEKAYSLVSGIELSAVVDSEVIANIAVVAAIGNGLAENYGVASRIYAALARERINVLMSCSGASPIVSYYIINDRDRTKAVRAVHREFFETNNDN